MGRDVEEECVLEGPSGNGPPHTHRLCKLRMRSSMAFSVLSTASSSRTMSLIYFGNRETLEPMVDCYVSGMFTPHRYLIYWESGTLEPTTFAILVAYFLATPSY